MAVAYARPGKGLVKLNGALQLLLALEAPVQQPSCCSGGLRALECVLRCAARLSSHGTCPACVWNERGGGGGDGGLAQIVAVALRMAAQPPWMAAEPHCTCT